LRALSPLPLSRAEEVIERSRIARSIGRTVPVVRHISPTRTVIVDEPIDRIHPLDRYPRVHPLDPLPRALPFDPLPRLSPSRKPLLRLYEEDELVHSLKE